MQNREYSSEKAFDILILESHTTNDKQKTICRAKDACRDYESIEDAF